METIQVAVKPDKKERFVFFPHYCYDCQCAFVAKDRHERCWSCNSENTINCFREFYPKKKNNHKRTFTN